MFGQAHSVSNERGFCYWGAISSPSCCGPVASTTGASPLWVLHTVSGREIRFYRTVKTKAQNHPVLNWDDSDAQNQVL
jgi:hypothetical protein